MAPLPVAFVGSLLTARKGMLGARRLGHGQKMHRVWRKARRHLLCAEKPKEMVPKTGDIGTSAR